mmetsp:Transcript_118766/g.296133  ORF Transcript_118766/g.296133 Transcript_118766/m.296133 type:complete len:238 (+) Transcript_118766:881-1594(+)
MKVPFTIIDLAPACSSLSTQSPRSMTNTSEMPPRSPECHIINMCFHVMMCSLSFGRVLATDDLMRFDSVPRGTTEASRPTKHTRKTMGPNAIPACACFVTTKTAMIPLNMKITVSASEDICFNKKEHNAMLSSDKCGGTYEPMRIELNTTVMIPDKPTHSAKENVKKHDMKTKRIACAGEAPMRQNRRIKIYTIAKAKPKAIEPTREPAIVPSNFSGSSKPCLFSASNTVIATASLI